MVDYDTAAAVVQDQQADPIMLAKIAYENPEFGANVAANPRCYPGLKRWIAEFGDERARQTLQAMGFAASEGGLSNPTAQHPEETEVAAETPHSTTVDSIDTLQEDYYGSGQQGYTNQQPQGQQGQNISAQQAPANPYGFTAEQALDPNTDQMTIARIAQYAPELRACLARNPNTYPELLNWLAQLNDPSINAALATRR